MASKSKAKAAGDSDRALLSDGADDHVRAFIWNIFAISNHFAEVRRGWASILGVSGPQWLILMAIDQLDRGEGAQVGEVSAKIHVNSTFVTAQSKQLEDLGFVARRSSLQDGRVVLLSLTDKARREIGALARRRQQVNDFIFGGLSDSELALLVRQSDAIRTRLERATLMVKLDAPEP